LFLDPDARMQLYGPDGLADHELLAFLLTRGGPPGEAAVRTARGVLLAAGALSAMARLGEAELIRVPGIGPSRARRIRALAALGRRMADRPLPRGAICDSPRAVYESVRGRLGKAEQEHLIVLLLDARMRKLAEVEIARGSSNAVYIHAREVFRPAVREAATGVIVVHNHPSGDSSPSEEDVRLTEMLMEAGAVLGIEVLDHIVVADGGFTSMSELGLVDGLGRAWRRCARTPRTLPADAFGHPGAAERDPEAVLRQGWSDDEAGRAP
jgi:DNA repair protein RadC